jgi:hypothetical protein
VLHWRSEVLLQVGCDAVLARDLAADGDIDLHDFLNLIDRGCSPQLAARILAPLDQDLTAAARASPDAPSRIVAFPRASCGSSRRAARRTLGEIRTVHRLAHHA